MNRRTLLTSLPALLTMGSTSKTAAAAPARRRLRSAICAYSYRTGLGKKTMSYEDLVRVAVENEVSGLDLTVYWFPNTSNAFLLPLKRAAYRNAVELYSISVRTEMTQPSADLQQKELAALRDWIDVAEKLGAGHIRVFGGRVPAGTTEEHAAGLVIECLKRAADYAGSKGVILGLENHGGITEKADTILRIVKGVDSPWVGVNLDTGNFNRDAYSQIEKCIPHAVNVQVKDEIRPGSDGKTEPSDWSRIGDLLTSGGYRGYLALEYEGKEDPSTAMPRLLKRLRLVTGEAV
ncbi:MAG: sugar phosphate isomerase/epimerase [Acidobacteria bacterium]|nr:sugar phosphate isomerase/epimerase [Acidobacteriota bacterium]